MVACGIALIAGMSALLLLREDPEYIVRASDDGIVTLTGMTRETQALAIVAGDPLTGAVFAGPTYRIGDEGVVLDADMHVTFKARAGEVAYRYRADVAAWEAVDDVTFVDGLLTFATPKLGTYALGVAETVTPPEFIATYDALRADAPENAVGYVMHVAYARPDEPPIVLEGVGEQGGCGGAVLPGNTWATSQATRTANVLVNDVRTTVTFWFRATWSLADGGCAELSPFGPAAEHGILPSS